MPWDDGLRRILTGASVHDCERLADDGGVEAELTTEALALAPECGLGCVMQHFTSKGMPTFRERVITLDDGAIYDSNAIWARFGNNVRTAALEVARIERSHPSCSVVRPQKSKARIAAGFLERSHTLSFRGRPQGVLRSVKPWRKFWNLQQVRRLTWYG